MDRQVGQLRFAACEEPLVQNAQLQAEHAHGPCVGDDVVERHRENVIVIAELDEHHAEQLIGQIEGPASLLGDDLQAALLRLRGFTQIDDG